MIDAAVGEDCDDGNKLDTDACLNVCTSASCGDGIIRIDLNEGDQGYEYCDDGDHNNDARANHCRTTCNSRGVQCCINSVLLYFLL